MRSRTRGIRFLVAAATTTLTLGLGLGLGTGSAAAAGQSTTAVPCSSGFVCLGSIDGMRTVNVRQGATASFSPPMEAAAITSRTSIWYCVDGTHNSAVPPGDTLFGIDGIIVSRLFPSPSGSCPA